MLIFEIFKNYQYFKIIIILYEELGFNYWYIYLVFFMRMFFCWLMLFISLLFYLYLKYICVIMKINKFCGMNVLKEV